MTIIRQPIILTIFAACLLYGALWLANPYVVLLSFSLVIMVGLPLMVYLTHGLSSPEFHQNISKLVLFLTSYVILAGVFLWLWLVAPMISLIIFLIVSSYHFGMDYCSEKTLMSSCISVLSGGAILCFPVLFHTDESFAIFSLLVGSPVYTEPLLLAAWLVTCGLYLLYHQRKDIVFELIGLGVLAFIFPPLLFFTLYFCGLHSMRHYLQHWPALRHAMVRDKYWVLALVIATYAMVAWVYFYFLSPASMPTNLVKTVFYVLAALTIPHMMVMTFFSAKSRQ